MVACSGLTLLHRGDDHFDEILHGLHEAREEVAIEIYQVRRDPVGWQVIAAAAAAARRGLRVRLLVDPFGCARTRDWMEWVAAQGVEVRWYNPWRPGVSPFDRTHRKLLIFDRRRASIGGINFAAEFSEQHRGARSWRDLGLWLEGPAAALLQAQFEAAWRGDMSGPPPLVPAALSGGEPCAVAGGRSGRDGHGATYLAMLESARQTVLLATPYFVPDAPFRAALVGAVERGVRVRVVVPRHCDIPTFKHAGRGLYHALLRAGVEIAERTDRMVHAKVAVVDGSLAALGSVNLNRQSFRSNSETLLLTAAPAVVEELVSLILREAAEALEPLTPIRWRSHPDRDRLAELASVPLGLVL